MKRLLYIFFALSFITLVMYLGGAAGNASTDLKTWSSEGRGILAMFWIIFVIVITGIGLNISKDELDKI